MRFELSTPSESSALADLLQNDKISDDESVSRNSNKIESTSVTQEEPPSIPVSIMTSTTTTSSFPPHPPAPLSPRRWTQCPYGCFPINKMNPEVAADQRYEDGGQRGEHLHNEAFYVRPHLQHGQGKRKRASSNSRKRPKPKKRKVSKPRKNTGKVKKRRVAKTKRK